MKPPIIIVLILYAISLYACSSTPVAEKSTQDSVCQSATTQAEMNECASQIAQTEYDKLNSLIDELSGHMDASQYTTLLEIETDWEKVAQNHCEWEAAFFSNGSIQPTMLAECLNKQYGQRIEVLRLNLCEGYGLTGECDASLKYK